MAHGLPVIKCINVVKSVQEERAKTFTVHFVTQRDHYKFEEYLNFVMERVSLNALETRNRSFLLNPSRHANGQNITHKCTYLGCPDFVTQVFHLNKLVHNGFRYYPLLASSGHIVDKVQCTWCGLQLGPFNDIVDIRPLHFQGNSELQLIACPFTAQ